MNAEQAKLIGKAVTESVLDFLASKHGTTARVIADLVAAGHATITAQFHQLLSVGLREAIEHFCA
jgi:hypothetical protein